MKDSYWRDAAASGTSTSPCTYAIELLDTSFVSMAVREVGPDPVYLLNSS